ncbi:MAG TPA: hypothetical protein VN843_29990 [Anaerolineales bacterium]|nr:hypothetical protein [Anaerolineales bacterium]
MAKLHLGPQSGSRLKTAGESALAGFSTEAADFSPRRNLIARARFEIKRADFDKVIHKYPDCE